MEVSWSDDVLDVVERLNHFGEMDATITAELFPGNVLNEAYFAIKIDLVT